MIPFISSHLIRMAANSSKLCCSAPPLLRAYNLSKQPFSLPQSTQDANLSHHCSFILTKSPYFPPLSFLPKNPQFGHFASSVHRIPSDEWRHHHPSVLDHVDTHNPLPKAAQPVSVGSVSFHREISPNSSAATAAIAEIPPTVRVSSLLPTSRTSAAADEPSGRSDACEESELSAKKITGNAPAAALFPESSPTLSTGGKSLRAGGRREMEVYQYPFRNRIETLIRLRSLRQVAGIIHQQWSQKLKAELFETKSNNLPLRERHEDESQAGINEVPTEESMTDMEAQPSNSYLYVLAITIDHSDTENNHSIELLSTREIEYSPQAFFTPPSQQEDQHESHSFDAVWEEDSLDWQKPLDEVSSDGTKTSAEEQNVASDEFDWLLQPFDSWRGRR